MIGLLLNEFYTIKNQLYKALIISLVFGIIFFFLSGTIASSIFSIYILSSIAIDYLNKEHSSGWNKLIPTLPIYRKTLVQSHFLFHISLIIVGMLIVNTYLAIFTNSYLSNLGDSFLGAGYSLIMSFVYPLIYIYGAEKYTSLQIYSAIFSGFILIGYLFLFEKITHYIYIFNDLNNTFTILLKGVLFIIVAILVCSINYLVSSKIINRIDL
ncbi:ABC-2 transporter permease [Staphylococcus equorum]|uniref:ABC-2 transporter permease n=2 Tax=Staphylococcus equorum TaxID=246432 RepID=UPI000D1C3153|nr:ABC-2 transporter permease [Staphylococcus equorum]PTE27105.1 hypothetical protein BUY91_09965 [Staphylococcus equorum]RIL27394.1 ABC-2 transporter permease [Staphylococcus equorum]